MSARPERVDVGSAWRCQVTEDVTFEDVMTYLFREIGFPLRHRWGGDAREFTEGVLIATRRGPPSAGVEP